MSVADTRAAVYLNVRQEVTGRHVLCPHLPGQVQRLVLHPPRATPHLLNTLFCFFFTLSSHQRDNTLSTIHARRMRDNTFQKALNYCYNDCSEPCSSMFYLACGQDKSQENILYLVYTL